MNKKDYITQLVKEAVITISDQPEPLKGGQHHNGSIRGVILEHRGEGFRVFCGNAGSITENHKLAVTLFELYLEEVLHD